MIEINLSLKKKQIYITEQINLIILVQFQILYYKRNIYQIKYSMDNQNKGTGDGKIPETQINSNQNQIDQTRDPMEALQLNLNSDIRVPVPKVPDVSQILDLNNNYKTVFKHSEMHNQYNPVVINSSLLDTHNMMNSQRNRVELQEQQSSQNPNMVLPQALSRPLENIQANQQINEHQLESKTSISDIKHSEISNSQIPMDGRDTFGDGKIQSSVLQTNVFKPASFDQQIQVQKQVNEVTNKLNLETVKNDHGTYFGDKFDSQSIAESTMSGFRQEEGVKQKEHGDKMGEIQYNKKRETTPNIANSSYITNTKDEEDPDVRNGMRISILADLELNQKLKDMAVYVNQYKQKMEDFAQEERRQAREMETELIKSIVLGTEASASAQKKHASPLRLKNPINGTEHPKKPHMSPY